MAAIRMNVYVRTERQMALIPRLALAQAINQYWIVQQTAVKRVLIKVVRKRWKQMEQMSLVA